MQKCAGKTRSATSNLEFLDQTLSEKTGCDKDIHASDLITIQFSIFVVRSTKNVTLLQN